VYTRLWNYKYGDSQDLDLVLSWWKNSTGQTLILVCRSSSSAHFQRLGHWHNFKLNCWYWQFEDAPATGRFSSVWIVFVPWTHLYKQKTKYTIPAANSVRTWSYYHYRYASRCSEFLGGLMVCLLYKPTNQQTNWPFPRVHPHPTPMSIVVLVCVLLAGWSVICY